MTHVTVLGHRDNLSCPKPRRHLFLTPSFAVYLEKPRASTAYGQSCAHNYVGANPERNFEDNGHGDEQPSRSVEPRGYRKACHSSNVPLSEQSAESRSCENDQGHRYALRHGGATIRSTSLVRRPQICRNGKEFTSNGLISPPHWGEGARNVQQCLPVCYCQMSHRVPRSW